MTHKFLAKPRTNRAFSLIEVAIALVIFVFGALAVLRIFPTGLGLVEKSANSRRADNLNASVLARYRAVGSVPDAVFHQVGGSWAPFNGYISRSASLEKNKISNSLPVSTQSTDYAASALSNVTAIAGETARVVRVGGQAYALTQFSIAGTPAIYRELSVVGAVFEAPSTTGPLANLNLNEATLEDGAVLPSPGAGNQLLVSFNFKSSQLGTPTVWQQNEQVVDHTTNILPIARPTTDATPILGSVDVVLRQVTTLPATTPNLLRAGIIALPTGFENDQTVQVDYTTNWSLVLQEVAASPASDPGFPQDPDNSQVPLSIPSLQTRGNGITVAAITPTEIGALQYRGEATPASPAPDNHFSFIRALDSEVRAISKSGNIGLRGLDGNALVRVAYRTRDDWTQQLAVAARTYKKYDGTNSQRWRDYDFVPTTTASNTPTLYFHASEAGKTVRVKYTMANNETREDVLVIPEELVAPPSTAILGGVAQVSRLRWTAPQAVTAIQSVNGESVVLRTAWLDNVRYNQSLLTSLRGGQS